MTHPLHATNVHGRTPCRGSLDSAQRYLRPGVTFEQLDSVAVALDDLAAARLLNAARDQLFRDIERRETQAA